MNKPSASQVSIIRGLRNRPVHLFSAQGEILTEMARARKRLKEAFKCRETRITYDLRDKRRRNETERTRTKAANVENNLA